MADIPQQRVEDHCPPQRPDETDDDYFVRWKAHRDAWRQQFLDDYYRSREGRLPSPNSEEGLDEEEMAHEVFLIEQCIRFENGQSLPGDYPNRVEPPRVVYPPGKSLSEISEVSDDEALYTPDPRGRPEDIEYDDRPWPTSPVPESRSMRKRSRSPAEDDPLGPPAKRRDTSLGAPQAGPSISNRKRKSNDSDDPADAREQAQAGPKRRRTDAHGRPSLASATSSSKRKRGSGPDEACDPNVQDSQPAGPGASRAKRRKVDEVPVTSSAAAGSDRSSTARVTRATRRQLSGKDAQLFQLGERGELDVQGQAYETRGQAHEMLGQVTEAAPKRSRRQRASATTNKPTANKPKASKPKARNAKTSAKMRATTSDITEGSAKVMAGNDTSTVTAAGTKARRGRPKRQVLTNS